MQLRDTLQGTKLKSYGGAVSVKTYEQKLLDEGPLPKLNKTSKTSTTSVEEDLPKTLQYCQETIQV